MTKREKEIDKHSDQYISCRKRMYYSMFELINSNRKIGMANDFIVKKTIQIKQKFLFT